MNRRNFIKSLAGLAALTVMPGVSLSASDAEKFEQECKSGLVTGKTFYLDRMATFRVDGLIIEHCKFITTKDFQGEYVMDLMGSGVTIQYCYFDMRASPQFTSVMRIGGLKKFNPDLSHDEKERRGWTPTKVDGGTIWKRV